jgi:hypothetical protein
MLELGEVVHDCKHSPQRLRQGDHEFKDSLGHTEITLSQNASQSACWSSGQSERGPRECG